MNFLRAIHAMETQDTRTVFVTDGGYCGKENTQLALEKNIQLITTNLTGKPSKEYVEYRKTGEFK